MSIFLSLKNALINKLPSSLQLTPSPEELPVYRKSIKVGKKAAVEPPQ